MFSFGKKKTNCCEWATGLILCFWSSGCSRRDSTCVMIACWYEACGWSNARWKGRPSCEKRYQNRNARGGGKGINRKETRNLTRKNSLWCLVCSMWSKALQIWQYFYPTIKDVVHMMRRGRGYLCNMIEFKKTISLWIHVVHVCLMFR